jgi:dienelactone hydrolase
MEFCPTLRTQSLLSKVVQCVIGAIACWFGSAPPAHSQITRDDLLSYAAADGRVLPVRTVEDWAHRRAAILKAAEEIMGPLPGTEKASPLDVQVTEEIDCGSYVRRLLSYASEPGSRVPAYLLIPKAALAGGGRAPAVLCLHPTDNKIGHGVVVGLGGKENRQYAVELAERGFVAIAPAYPQLANYQPDLPALGYVSGTMKAIHDNRRALDLLDSLPFVRAGQYAAIGHSLGGHNSVYTAMFDDRLRVVVSSCGLDSYRDYMKGDIRGWTSSRYMPRLLQWRERLSEVPVDFAEMIAAIAPRTVFISAPLHDDNFRADSVDRLTAAARTVFALHGATDRLIVEHPDAGHDFPDAMREKAYRLIEETIKPAR